MLLMGIREVCPFLSVSASLCWFRRPQCASRRPVSLLVDRETSQNSENNAQTPCIPYGSGHCCPNGD